MAVENMQGDARASSAIEHRKTSAGASQARSRTRPLQNHRTHFTLSLRYRFRETICEEFAPRTVWSLSNAFTSAFKDLDPIPQFKNNREACIVP
jgi:hypothetical protein